MVNDQSKFRRVLWPAFIVWTIASLIALCIAMAVMKFDRSRTSEAAALNLRSLWPYWIASAAAWLGLTGMWWSLRNSGAGGDRFVRSAGFILMIAIGARAAVLVTHDPALSDDVYRYIFEGRTFAAGFNPYLVKGADRLGAPTENFTGERLLLETPPDISTTRLVTYGELATPYLPVSHLVFGGLGWIINHNDRWSDPISSARVFRVGFTCIELIAICLLFIACRRAGRSAWWVALYAWHPLPICEIAGSGHQDINGIVLMIGALLMFSMKRVSLQGATASERSESAVPTSIGSPPHGRLPSVAGRGTPAVWSWAALLTFSVLVKPITATAGLMMLWQTPSRERVRTAGRAALVGAPIAAVLIGLFWIIMDHTGQAFANWRATANELSQKWAHFGGLYELVLAAIRRLIPAEGRYAGFNLFQEIAARRVCILILAIACILILLKSRNVWRGTAAMLLAIVLCTTTAHPWYLLWAFALFPLADVRSLWALSLTLPWGYAVFATLGRPDWPWISPWVYVAAYAPVYAAAAWDVVSSRRSQNPTASASSPAIQ